MKGLTPRMWQCGDSYEVALPLILVVGHLSAQVRPWFAAALDESLHSRQCCKIRRPPTIGEEGRSFARQYDKAA